MFAAKPERALESSTGTCVLGHCGEYYKKIAGRMDWILGSRERLESNRMLYAMTNCCFLSSAHIIQLCKLMTTFTACLGGLTKEWDSFWS